jgi:hypothetical protein
MTAEEFRNLVNTRTDRQLLGPCLHDEDPPYVCEPDPDSWGGFREAIVTALKISASDIRVIGSARLGFSLTPGKNLRRFGDKSDVDVLIVNADLFDNLWLALLAAAYPRLPASERLGGWLQRRRNEVYTGWISPEDVSLDKSIFGSKAVPVLDFRTRWFTALRAAAQLPARRFEGISGRLYRTWQHAELYHLQSLGELRRSLAA